MRKTIATLVLLLAAAVPAGCGSSNSTTTAASAPRVGDPCDNLGATTPDRRLWCDGAHGWVEYDAEAVEQEAAEDAAAAAQARLTLFPSDDTYIKKPQIRVRGRTEPGAVVTVRLDEVQLARVRAARDGRWEHTVPLAVGANTIDAIARAEGKPASERRAVWVERERTAEEIAALRAKREQDFRSAAETIPYSQLIKDPESFRGRKVRYYGQIFQIQQADGAGVMLLSVTDLGYDLWDDNIWVNYEGNIKGADGDMITVYGTMTGAESYETQIGGETYVPRMRAAYWDE